MLKFNWAYINAYNTLKLCLNEVTRRCDVQGAESSLCKSDALDLERKILLFESECKESKFQRPLERFNKLRNIADNSSRFTLRVLKSELIELLEAADNETARRKYFVLAGEDTSSFNLRCPFGEDVYNKFKSSRYDIREAKNCYVLGRYTACVFHAMRALEHPLHALARKLKIAPPKKTPKKPIDLETWGTVINRISAAINARTNPKSRKESELTEFYNKAADQFHFFKDAWRDVVMHSRSRPYGQGEAKDILKSVETFMRRLATQLKE